MMKVLFVSPEVNPIVRTGGLGDVVGSLPLALHSLGIDVRVVCPFHRASAKVNVSRHSKCIKVDLEKNVLSGSLLESYLGGSGVPVYLIDIPELFDRSGVYSDEKGDFPDNPQRAFALSQGALQIGEITGWHPEVIHAHDWMAAPVCAYVNAKTKKKPDQKRIRSVLTIHNLQHQGVFSYEDFRTSGLPDSFWGIDGFEHNGSMNLLKGGIQHADKITTVSPTYAEEIRTPEYGCNLEASLQYRGADLIGILNGIDEKAWDSQSDDALPTAINPQSPREGKLVCKKALLKELSVNGEIKAPLFGVVSRLFNQKGLDLLVTILPRILEETNAHFAILGSGDRTEEQNIKDLAAAYPDRIGAFIGFDDGLARRIFGGSDFFLMPSRFEPCGLAQQYAMRYGALPIARKTGGLADTIRPLSTKESNPNGFLFADQSSQALLSSIRDALNLFSQKRKFAQLRKNAMSQNCGWEQAASQYIQAYKWAMNDTL